MDTEGLKTIIIVGYKLDFVIEQSKGGKVEVEDLEIQSATSKDGTLFLVAGKENFRILVPEKAHIVKEQHTVTITIN